MIRAAFDLANALTGYRLSRGNRLRVALQSAQTADEVQRQVRALAGQIRRQNADAYDALNVLGNLLHRYDRDTAQALAVEALKALPTEAAGAWLVRCAEAVDASPPASFRQCLTMRSIKKRFGDLPEWTLNGKQAAYEFADRLDVPRPRTHAHGIPFADIAPTLPVVVKPVNEADSRGVYLVFEPNRIFDVHNNKPLPSWPAMAKRIKANLASGLLTADEWIVEELIIGPGDGPARDLKCYSFYGRTELVLEIWRYPALLRRWLTRDGEMVETGIYRANFSTPPKGLEVAVALADRISAAIPAPFMRIDLLAGRDGPVLGEFTPRPGGYHGFNEHTDAWLGERFLEAEERLTQDLLEGKRFDAFRAHRQQWQSAFVADVKAGRVSGMRAVK